ncbi:MAG: hydroxymethylbilane synthase [Verrucomicrobiales bacterium]|nr:hydroxymethylbilane synthase [Verrucomicrobiales bacterium]
MPDTKSIILGTRGSDLALAQATMTEAALREHGIAVEIRVIKTIGDKRPDLKLTEFADHGVVDKGVFTKELEEALMADEIDIAVHSLKDVPTEIADAFVIPCTLPRAPIEDVILTKQQGLFAEPTGLDRIVATSSVRRARMMKHLFPGLTVEDIRGNVPTRIRKLVESDSWDGILLARAGLVRLGILDPADDADGFDFEGTRIHTKILDPTEFIPAAGQGAVAIECRKNDDVALGALAKINHEPTFRRIEAERAFLAALKAGCQTPVGAHTWFEGDELAMRVRVFDEEDEASEPVEGEVRGDDPVVMADVLMEQISK